MEKSLEQPGRTRILVVDDDPWVLQMCQKTLSEMAHVVVAQSAGEAMDMLDDAPFDTLLTDLHMPDISGLDLVSAVTMLHPEIRCLMMTGCLVDDARHVEALRRGVAVLQKPFTVAGLREFALTDSPLMHPSVF